MQWQEVRELFPNQFVLLSILDYREEEGKKIITEVAPVRVILEKDANREFFNVEPRQLVYHTSNEECVVHLRNDPPGKNEAQHMRIHYDGFASPYKKKLLREWEELVTLNDCPCARKRSTG